ncbi:MAG: hypothetical protein Q7K55_00945 [Candidatus Levybacteria bacterium]|nr:hypothetical protein [Candidatus Levybacteria bacterium]
MVEVLSARSGFTHGPDITEFSEIPQKVNDLISTLGENFRDNIKDRMLGLKIFLPNGTPDFLSVLDPHKGSKAQYLLDNYKNLKEGAKKEKDRVLISYIPPFSETSTHYHIENMIEEYYLLAGELKLFAQKLDLIGQGHKPNEETIPREGLIVFPGIVHRAQTQDQGALTLIVMRNAVFVDENKHHISAPSL